MAKQIISEVEKQLRDENRELRIRLTEAEERLKAICKEEADTIDFQRINGEITQTPASDETAYRNLIDAMNEGLANLLADGTILYCNRRFSELMTVTQEKAIGTNISRFFDEQEKPKFEALLKEGSKKRCFGEFRYSAPDGEFRCLYLSFSPFLTSLIMGVCVVISDITDRKLAEEKLRKSEEFHFSLFNMLNGFAYCKINYIGGQLSDFTYLIVNNAFEALTGLKDVIGKKVSEIIPRIHEIDPELIQLYARVASSGNSESVEIYLKSLKAWFSISVYSPEKDYFVAVFDLITERKEAEIALKESEYKYRELVENSPDAIVIYAQGKIVFVNRESLYLMRASSPEDLIGKQVIQFVHPDYKEFVIERMKKMENEGLVLSLVDEKFVRLDGSEVDVEVKPMSIKFDNKNAVQLIIRDITERKKAEEALHISEEKWRTIFEILPVGVSIQDKNGNVSEHNPALEKILKLTADELRQHKYKNRKYLYYENGEFNLDELPSYTSINEHKIIRNVEVGVVAEEGEIIWTEVSAAPLNLPDLQSVIVTTDITGHKQLEEELKRSSLLLETTQKLTRVGGWEWDIEKQIMFWTKEMYDLYGFDQDKYIPETPANFDLHLECFLPEDRAGIRKALQRCLDEGESCDLKSRLTTAEGRFFWVRVIAKPVLKKGKVVRIIGVIMDINENILFEQELKKTNELNTLFMKYSPIYVFIKDVTQTESRVVMASENYIDMIGIPGSKMVGKRMDELFPLEFAKKISDDDWSVLCSGQEMKLDEYLNGHFYTTIKFPIFHGDRTLLAGYTIDITDRKLAENEIQLKNEELISLNAAKDKFFSIIAHDLRGPLSGFLGLTEIMAEDSVNILTVEFHKMAVMLKDSAKNIFHLLGNLLEWSRMQRGLTTFSPGLLLLRSVISESIVQIIKDADNKDIIIGFKIPEDLIVFADKSMVESILRNLASNAVKYTHQGGRITVSARSDSEKNVEISIADSGIGMSKDMIENLFRLDVNTNRKGTKGEYSTGLGLIICKDFIERHGGKFWIESEEGKGSTFRFTLPRNAGSNG